MALMDAKEYDPRPAQRRWRIIWTTAAVILIPLLVWYFFFYYWPEKRAVNKFFAALERHDFETAYGIYKADPDWKQHPDKYKDDYPFPQFKLDWGPSGEYGPITSHAIDCTTEYKKGGSRASGVIVVVVINGRSQVMLNDRSGPVSLWVEKKSKAITVSPYEAQCHAPR